jgi:hypothetical protein
MDELREMRDALNEVLGETVTEKESSSAAKVNDDGEIEVGKVRFVFDA